MTSVDILRERDDLRARVDELEALLGVIDEEIDLAERAPEVSFTTLCRIAAIVRSNRRPSLKKAVPRE